MLLVYSIVFPLIVVGFFVLGFYTAIKLYYKEEDQRKLFPFLGVPWKKKGKVRLYNPTTREAEEEREKKRNDIPKIVMRKEEIENGS